MRLWKKTGGKAVNPEEVERRAFGLLLASGRPLAPDHLAHELAGDGVAVAAVVADLAEAGVFQRNDDGLIVGVSGLSVEPTSHEFVINGMRLWTWCAFDALGFVACAGRGGAVRSRCPETGTPVVVRFEDERVEADPAEAVVVFADRPEGRVHEVWCPLVNLFAADDAARSWMERHGISGEIQTPGESAQVGVRRFERFFAQ